MWPGEYSISAMLDVQTKEFLFKYEAGPESFGWPGAYSPEGSYYALTHSNMLTFRIFDAQTFEYIVRISEPTCGYGGDGGLAYSPDGTKVVVGAYIYDVSDLIETNVNNWMIR